LREKARSGIPGLQRGEGANLAGERLKKKASLEEESSM